MSFAYLEGLKIKQGCHESYDIKITNLKEQFYLRKNLLEGTLDFLVPQARDHRIDLGVTLLAEHRGHVVVSMLCGGL